MKPITHFIVLIIFISSLAAPSILASHKAVLFLEEFSNLDNWKPFFSPNIKKHSSYSIEKENGNHHFKVESNAVPDLMKDLFLDSSGSN